MTAAMMRNNQVKIFLVIMMQYYTSTAGSNVSRMTTKENNMAKILKLFGLKNLRINPHTGFDRM